MTRPVAVRRACAAAIVVAMLALGTTGRAEDLILLSIDRVQPVRVPPGVAASLVPLVELRTVWIASAPSAVIRQLQQAGASFTILDLNADRAPLQLIRTRMEDPARQWPGTARSWPVEDGLWLLAGVANLTREQLPPDASFAPVAGPIHVPIVFETVSDSRAVVRRPSASSMGGDPRVATLLAQVSREYLAAHIQNLESFQTRYATTSNARSAAESIYQHFRQLGVTAHTEEFVSNNVTVSNVIATIPGHVSPEQVIIVGAHYDSYARTAFLTSAPGADDNATGTAAVMEMARVLVGQPFDFTIRLIAFGAEETGLNGSRDYATRARQRGEQVLAMLDLDMIGYVDRAPEDLDVTANPASTWLVDYFVTTAAAYTGLPIRRIVNASSRSSDHAPFWDQGYSAVEIIEDDYVPNPYYHTIADRFTTLDMDFATAAVRTTLAVAATLAQPVNSPAPPATLQVHSRISSSLFTNVSTTLVEWERSRDVAGGYYVYQATAAHGDYRRLNTTPITTTSFVLTRFFRATATPDPIFYVVTTVDTLGREGNRSMEVRAQ